MFRPNLSLIRLLVKQIRVSHYCNHRMDISKPGFTIVGNRCYRNCTGGGEQVSDFDGNTCDWQLNPVEDDMNDVDEEDESIDISQKEDKFVHQLKVPPILMGQIIGKGGNNLRKLQDQTQSEIGTGRKDGRKDDYLIIKAESKKLVIRARKIINAEIRRFRETREPTHFVSVPISLDKDKYEAFKNWVRESLGDGHDDEIFQKEIKMHLTFCVLFLDKTEYHEANIMFENYLKKWFNERKPGKTSGIRINIQGVGFFGARRQNDPKNANVVFATINQDRDVKNTRNDLQALANGLQDLFSDNFGTMQTKGPVKLHLTLMNTKFLDRENHIRKTFNASRIIRKFADFDFGTRDLKNIDLCFMNAEEGKGYKKLATFDIEKICSSGSDKDDDDLGDVV